MLKIHIMTTKPNSRKVTNSKTRVVKRTERLILIYNYVDDTTKYTCDSQSKGTLSFYDEQKKDLYLKTNSAIRIKSTAENVGENLSVATVPLLYFTNYAVLPASCMKMTPGSVETLYDFEFEFTNGAKGYLVAGNLMFLADDQNKIVTCLRDLYEATFDEFFCPICISESDESSIFWITRRDQMIAEVFDDISENEVK